MASIRTTTPPDEEFRTPVEAWPTRYPAPATYLRVLANPFLGVAVFLLTLGGLVQLATLEEFHNAPPLMFLLIGALALAALPKLCQFHCLDCGVTRPLRDWKDHACFPSALRRHLNRRARSAWPTPGVQVVIWILGSCFLLQAVAPHL